MMAAAAATVAGSGPGRDSDAVGCCPLGSRWLRSRSADAGSPSADAVPCFRWRWSMCACKRSDVCDHIFLYYGLRTFL